MKFADDPNKAVSGMVYVAMAVEVVALPLGAGIFTFKACERWTDYGANAQVGISLLVGALVFVGVFVKWVRYQRMRSK